MNYVHVHMCDICERQHVHKYMRQCRRHVNLPLLVNTSMPISSEERSEVEVDTTSSACHAAGSSASTANEKGAHHRPKIILKNARSEKKKRKEGKRGRERERKRKKEKEKEKRERRRKREREREKEREGGGKERKPQKRVSSRDNLQRKRSACIKINPPTLWSSIHCKVKMRVVNTSSKQSPLYKSPRIMNTKQPRPNITSNSGQQKRITVASCRRQITCAFIAPS